MSCASFLRLHPDGRVVRGSCAWGSPAQKSPQTDISRNCKLVHGTARQRVPGRGTGRNDKDVWAWRGARDLGFGSGFTGVCTDNAKQTML